MTSEGNGTQMYMPVAPAYAGGNGFGMGGDWGSWIILFLIFGMFGGWGNGNGYGGGGNGLYPWMNQSNQINDGFQNQLLNDNITSIRDGITGISSQLCNGFSQAEIAENSRQMANMNQMFSLQSAMQNCCCENRQATNDVKYTIATEACNTRAANTANTQAILDKLCQLELDGVKAQVEAKNDRIAELQNQLNMANLQASQTAQNAFIQQGFSNEVDALYNRLNSCPVPTTPVYGRTPIFTCGCNTGCGCGNNF